MSDTKLKVRGADQSDLPAILRLNKVVQDLHASARPDVFHSDASVAVAEHFGRLFDSEVDVLLVAEIDGQAVGYVHGEVQRRAAGPFARARARLYVHHLGVEPDFRRQGVGSALVGHLQDLAAQAALDSIALDTWSFNDEARAFFEEMGFTPYNVRYSKTLIE